MNRTTIALSLMTVLLGSVLLTGVSNAYAQTGAGTYGKLSQTMRINYSDGSFSTVQDTEYFKPAIIAGQSGRTMTSLTIQLNVELPSSSDTLQYGGATQIVKVLRPDGTWREVLHTPTVNDYNIRKTGDRTWNIYFATIPVKDIIAAIGPSSPNFQSEIRVNTGSHVAFYGTVGGKTGGFYTTQTVTTFKVTANAQTVEPGPIDNTGGSGTISPTPQEQPPTGKVYAKIKAVYTDGTVDAVILGNKVSLPQGDILVPGTKGKAVRSIIYVLVVQLDDQNAFVDTLKRQSGYGGPGLPDNYDAILDGKVMGKSLTKNVNTVITRDGLYTREVLTMSVSASDIEPNLKVDNGFYSGKLTMYTQGYILPVATSSGKIYNINLPKVSVSIDLIGSQTIGIGDVNPDPGHDDTSCEIQGDECTTESNNVFQVDQVYLVGGIILVIAGAGAGIYYKKRN